MRAPLLAVILGSILASAGLAGCIQGAFFPAEAGSLASGWSKDEDNSEGGQRGLEPLVRARYQVNAYTQAAAPPGAFYVISVSDVPLLDEQNEISKQLEPRLDEMGLQREQVVQGTGTVGSDAARWTLFNARLTMAGITLTGKAIDVQYTCGANGEAVRVFGVASTQGTGSFLPGSGPTTDDATWRELVGGNGDPAAGLGGMVAAVRCS